MKYFQFKKFVATKKGKTTRFSPLLFCCCCWIRDPGWRKIRIRCRINIPDPQHCPEKMWKSPTFHLWCERTWNMREPSIQKIWSSSRMDMPERMDRMKIKSFLLFYEDGGRAGLKSLTGREQYASVAKGRCAPFFFFCTRFRSYRHHAKLWLAKGFTMRASQWKNEILHGQNVLGFIIW